MVAESSISHQTVEGAEYVIRLVGPKDPAPIEPFAIAERPRREEVAAEFATCLPIHLLKRRLRRGEWVLVKEGESHIPRLRRVDAQTINDGEVVGIVRGIVEHFRV